MQDVGRTVALKRVGLIFTGVFIGLVPLVGLFIHRTIWKDPIWQAAILVGLWMLYHLRHQFIAYDPKRETEELVTFSKPAYARAMVVGWFLFALLTMMEYALRLKGGADLPHPLWRILGILPAVGGLWLRVKAVKTLGKFFTLGVRIHADQKLVQEGLYKRIRHPAYSGLLLINSGAVIGFWSLWGLVFTVLCYFPIIWLRLRYEEGVLYQFFGPPYEEYKKRTHALIPYIL